MIDDDDPRPRVADLDPPPELAPAVLPWGPDRFPVRLREVHLRYTDSPARFGREPLRHPADIARLAGELVQGDNREHFLAFYLDTRHRILAVQTVHIGTLSQSLVHPREVLAPALALGAHAVIVAHNHPSGDTGPSAEDRDLTTRLKAAAELLGLRLLDHVIWTRDGYVSLSELGGM